MKSRHIITTIGLTPRAKTPEEAAGDLYVEVVSRKKKIKRRQKSKLKVTSQTVSRNGFQTRP